MKKWYNKGKELTKSIINVAERKTVMTQNASVSTWYKSDKLNCPKAASSRTTMAAIWLSYARVLMPYSSRSATSTSVMANLVCVCVYVYVYVCMYVMPCYSRSATSTSVMANLVCVCVYVYVYVCMCVCIVRVLMPYSSRSATSTSVMANLVCVCVYVYVYVCMCVCIARVLMPYSSRSATSTSVVANLVCVCVYVCACTYVCMYIYMHTHTHTRTHTFTLLFFSFSLTHNDLCSHIQTPYFLGISTHIARTQAPVHVCKHRAWEATNTPHTWIISTSDTRQIPPRTPRGESRRPRPACTCLV